MAIILIVIVLSMNIVLIKVYFFPAALSRVQEFQLHHLHHVGLVSSRRQETQEELGCKSQLHIHTHVHTSNFDEEGNISPTHVIPCFGKSNPDIPKMYVSGWLRCCIWNTL